MKSFLKITTLTLALLSSASAFAAKITVGDRVYFSTRTAESIGAGYFQRDIGTGAVTEVLRTVRSDSRATRASIIRSKSLESIS